MAIRVEDVRAGNRYQYGVFTKVVTAVKSGRVYWQYTGSTHPGGEGWQAIDNFVKVAVPVPEPQPRASYETLQSLLRESRDRLAGHEFTVAGEPDKQLHAGLIERINEALGKNS